MCIYRLAELVPARFVPLTRRLGNLNNRDDSLGEFQFCSEPAAQYQKVRSDANLQRERRSFIE